MAAIEVEVEVLFGAQMAAIIDQWLPSRLGRWGDLFRLRLNRDPGSQLLGPRPKAGGRSFRRLLAVAGGAPAGVRVPEPGKVPFSYFLQ